MLGKKNSSFLVHFTLYWMKRKFFVTQTKVIFCAAVETVCTLMCSDTKGQVCQIVKTSRVLFKFFTSFLLFSRKAFNAPSHRYHVTVNHIAREKKSTSDLSITSAIAINHRCHISMYILCRDVIRRATSSALGHYRDQRKSPSHRIASHVKIYFMDSSHLSIV